MLDFILQTLASSATSTLLIALVTWLSREWIGARIKSDIENTYAIKLEDHKHKLKLNQDRELEELRSRIKGEQDRDLEEFRSRIKGEQDRDLEEFRSRIKGEQDRDLEKYRFELRLKQESEIEALRADIAKDRAMQNLAVTAFSSAHNASMERKIKAVETLWKTTLECRNAANTMMGRFDTLTRREIEEVKNKNPTNFKLAIGATVDLVKFRQEYDKPHSDLDIHRPFIGEGLWFTYYAYRMILGAILAKIATNKISFWLDDPMAVQFLASVMTQEEIDLVKRTEAGSIIAAEGIIERKIIQAIGETISGQESSDVATRQANRIFEASLRPIKNDWPPVK